MPEPLIISAQEVHKLPTLQTLQTNTWIPVSVNMGVSGYQLFKVRATNNNTSTVNSSYIEASFSGDVIASRVFGIFKPRSAVRLVGMEASVQDAPTGSNVSVALTTESGAETAQSVTILADNDYGTVTFNPKFPMDVNTVWRFKITEVGSLVPGSNLLVRLILQ